MCRVARPRSWAAIEAIEAAYRAACNEPARWLERVVEEAVPILDHGADVFAYEYDTNRAYPNWVVERPIVARGDPAVSDEVLGTFADTPRELNEKIHRGAGPVTILSELLGQAPSEHDAIGPHAKTVAMKDLIGVNAGDPSGRGTFFCAISKKRVVRDNARVHALGMVGAHLSAASRLRRVLAARPLPDAVLDADGKVVHAATVAAARETRAALGRAAKKMDHARMRSQRTEPAALESWHALVEGRWSLVDVVERDGKRFLFAHPNAPAVTDPRRLTDTERVIAGFVVMGHGNKLIAYELGLALGTVSAHLHSVLKKIGARSRVDLVDRFAMLTKGETTQVSVANERVAVVTSRAATFAEKLTSTERAVATLAAGGASNADIARARGAAVRTIENQLASIYRKLGVHSRSELACAANERP